MEASFKLRRAILNNIYITSNHCGGLVVPCGGRTQYWRTFDEVCYG